MVHLAQQGNHGKNHHGKLLGPAYEILVGGGHLGLDPHHLWLGLLAPGKGEIMESITYRRNLGIQKNSTEQIYSLFVNTGALLDGSSTKRIRIHGIEFAGFVRPLYIATTPITYVAMRRNFPNTDGLLVNLIGTNSDDENTVLDTLFVTGNGNGDNGKIDYRLFSERGIVDLIPGDRLYLHAYFRSEENGEIDFPFYLTIRYEVIQ